MEVPGITIQKEGQIHPKRPPGVTSCPTEQCPGAWGSASARITLFYLTALHLYLNLFIYLLNCSYVTRLGLLADHVRSIVYM
jgi:hypothetical protein